MNGGASNGSDSDSSSDACEEESTSTITSSSISSDSSSNSDSESSSDSEQYSLSPSAPVNGAGRSGNEDDDEAKDDDEPRDDAYTSAVREWVDRVPIALNLCPWARLSRNNGRTRCVTCPSASKGGVSVFLEEEIDRLLDPFRFHRPWTTTLVVCPLVGDWKEDFGAFDKYVGEFAEEVRKRKQRKEEEEQDGSSFPGVSLVAFHPLFLRWRGLPAGVGVGSRVLCHAGRSGFSKSKGVYPATVVDPRPELFGQRRIKVRFCGACEGSGDNGKRSRDTRITERAVPDRTPEHPFEGKEQYVPVDWVVPGDREGEHEHAKNEGPPLSDNAMHRAPFPVVHLIRNEDLSSLCARDVSRLKRRNAPAMMGLSLDEV